MIPHKTTVCKGRGLLKGIAFKLEEIKLKLNQIILLQLMNSNADVS